MWQRSVVLLLAGAVTLAACTSPTNTTHEVTVPALWVSGSSGTQQEAGVERAVVRAATVGPPGFTINLADVQAQGAGVQWQAATSVAATVATLFSGIDPRQIDLGYSVTGPIDGPSAGGVLTVGSLAAMTGDALDAKVTMTGTVAPDGTIGSVGGISAKLKAAAAAGFTTVLIPVGSETEISTTGDSVNLVELGKTLNLQVRPVTDVTAAYEVFTGKPIAPAPGASTALDEAVSALTIQQANTLSARFDARVQEVSTELTPEEMQNAQSDAMTARSAIASGKPAVGYGILVLAMRTVERKAARAATQQRIKTAGLARARSEVVSQATQQATRATSLLDNGASEPSLGVEQAASLPFALAPVAYAEASMASIASGLTSVNDPESIATAAADLADQTFTIDVLAPNELAVVRASSSRPSAFARAPEFLAGYIDFLNRGSEATLEYLRTVSGSRASTQPGSASQAAVVLGEKVAAQTTSSSSLATALRDLSCSVAYFLVSEDLVSRQPLGLPPPGFEEQNESRKATALSSAIDSGARLAQLYGSSLVEGGSGVDSALWRSKWGASQLDANSAATHVGLAALAALHEQWSAVLNCLLIRASRSQGEALSDTSPS